MPIYETKKAQVIATTLSDALSQPAVVPPPPSRETKEAASRALLEELAAMLKTLGDKYKTEWRERSLKITLSAGGTVKIVIRRRGSLVIGGLDVRDPGIEPRLTFNTTTGIWEGPRGSPALAEVMDTMAKLLLPTSQ